MATPEAGLCPEDSIQAALQAFFPGRPPQALDSAAAWLQDNFGVVEYADLEGATIWAEDALGILAVNDGLAPGARGVLEELLASFAGAGPGVRALPASEEANVSAAEPEAAPATPEAAAAGAGGGTARRDDFLVVGRLGAGTFATVHKVVERTSQQVFALKEVNASRLCDHAFREQIERETVIHGDLSHPHILRCYESFEAWGTVFLLLELANCGDLYRYMRDAKVLREAEAARLFSEIASGIHYLHLQGAMHRDLKPENILLHGDGRHAKIADFGWCARAAERQSGECGSPAYFAPEMVDGCSYDGRVDVWALGILLYEMLVGHSPFSSALTETETRRRISKLDFGSGAWSTVPGTAQPLIRSLLRREPADRPLLLDALADSWLASLVGSTPRLAAAELEQGRRPEAQGPQEGG